MCNAMELKFDQLQLPKRKLLLTPSARVSCVRIKLRSTYITLFGIHWFLLLDRPPHGGGVWAGGSAPSPENFSIFELKKPSFAASLVLFFAVD